MQVEHFQSRDAAVSNILTMSSCDEQHTAAGYFCVKRNFGYKRGLSTARAEDPDIWPEVTSGSLRRVLHLHGENFKNVPEFTERVRPLQVKFHCVRIICACVYLTVFFVHDYSVIHGHESHTGRSGG